MAQLNGHTFTTNPEGDGVTVAYAKHEGVACRFNRVDGVWSVTLVPGGLATPDAKAILDAWIMNGCPAS
jgi:hypothetical protein